MDRFKRYMLSGIEEKSAFFLTFWGVLSLVMSISFIFIDYEKRNKVWPEFDDLVVASGSVVVFEYDKRGIDFTLSGSDVKLHYQPLYGRKMDAIKNALRNPLGSIEVRFRLNQSGVDGQVLALSNGGEAVLTYQESRKTFKDDLAWMPILLVFFLSGGCYMLFGARYQYRRLGRWR